MKNPEDFSDKAVLKRSQEATKELDVARRSARVKRMLDAAAARKDKGMLKEFSELRSELTEIDEHVNIAHSSMPPNILILKRKTVRQFPNQTMVALYYNDKLDQFFSIPYGGEAQSIVNPVALAKEEVVQEGAISHLTRVKAFQTDKPLFHHDGTQTKIDPQTANALLTVHGALHPTNQKKFVDALEHSKDKFHKMVDFSWKQVK